MKKILALMLAVILLLFLCSCSCEHDWQEATCSTPKTCGICGETSGDVLAHQWKEATCVEAKTCSLCGMTEGNTTAHEWVAATCTEAKTCFNCKTIEGEPLGHKWEEETCTTPETCSVCGLENGSPLGHTLTETKVVKEASCFEVGTIEGYCTTCGKTLSEEIPVLEHTPGEWAVAEEATYDSAGIKAVSCTECETVMEEETYELTEEEKEAWFKKACTKVPYDDIARNADQYIGQMIAITGEVWVCWEESQKEGETSIYQVATERSYGFYSGEDYFVFVENGIGPRILREDIITFYGIADGLYDSYGDYRPKLNAVYYDIK